jgi:hypothetical protein
VALGREVPVAKVGIIIGIEKAERSESLAADTNSDKYSPHFFFAIRVDLACSRRRFC